jgi:hypothetical protein
MGMPPARQEVQLLQEEIDRTLNMIGDQSHLLERILRRMHNLGLDETDMAAIRMDLVEVRNAVTVVKSRVRFAKSG